MAPSCSATKRARALAARVTVTLAVAIGVSAAATTATSAATTTATTAATTATTTAQVRAASPKIVTPLPSAFGAYAGPANLAGLSEIDQLVGYHVHYAMDFLDGDTWQSISDPAWPVEEWEGSGYTMVWGVPIIPNSGGSLAAGAAGDYDHWFVALSQYLVAHGQADSIIRIGWEFNGGWFAWGADHHAAQFVDYYRQIVDSMRSVAGADYLFEWNPTLGDQGLGPLSEYYPGNQYVSIIADDVYDMNWGSYPGHAAEWRTILTEPYGLDWLSKFAASHHKLVAFPEWGLGWTSGGEVGGGDDVYFVNHMATWIERHHCIAATFWDYPTPPPITTADPLATTAIEHDFAN